VDEVVERCADAGVHEITQHEEVGREEEQGEEEPAVVEVLVGVEGEDEEGRFLGAEEGGGPGEHGSFIRFFGRDGSLVTAKAKADSFAALRNNKQKSCAAE
jgi:hypothetical protein